MGPHCQSWTCSTKCALMLLDGQQAGSQLDSIANCHWDVEQGFTRMWDIVFMVFMYKQLPLSRTENNTLLSPFKWAKGTSTFTTPAKATRATEKASSQHPGKAVPPAKAPRGAGENPRTPHAPRADDLSHSHNLTLYVLPHLMALMVFIMVFMVFIMVFIFLSSLNYF